MLRYFRINDPYRLLAILVLLLLSSLPVLIDFPGLMFPELKSIILGDRVSDGFTPYTQIIDSSGPLADWFHAFNHFIFGSSLTGRHIFGFFLLFIQASMLGFIFLDKKVFPESTYVPSLIFAILCTLSYDMVAPSGELAGSFFLLLAINSIFKELEFKEQRNENVFNAGLFVGIASLFCFSFSLFIAGTLIILGLYSRSSAPKFFLTIVGFCMPHLLLVSIYYLNGGVEELWAYFYLANFTSGPGYFSISSLVVTLVLPLTFLAVSLFILTRESRFTKYQSQLVQAMFFWLVCSALEIWYSRDTRPQSLIVLFPAFSFYISHMLLMIRRKKLAEGSLLIMLIGVPLLSILSRYDVVNLTNYSDMLVKRAPLSNEAQKIVVLGDDISLYNQKKLATPFFDWSLSKATFESPEYYDNQLKVYHSFVADPPDLVIDSADLLGPFLQRMPDLKKKYSRTNEGYKRISN